ncbi:MAG TPA: SDR family oxidoreductase [Terriglobales bacterium]
MILITGASGNVGKEVLKQAAASGAKVRAAFQTANKAATAPSGVEIATLDYNQPETLRAALKGIDKVFLVGPPAQNLVALERKAVDAIKQAGGAHIVKLSATGGRAAIYPRQHAESEDYIKSSGVPYTFLRPNGFMQNLVNYNAPTINAQNAFYGCQGEGKVSHVDVRDVAAVAVKALTEDRHQGKTYTLTGPRALTNAELAQILSDDLGREIRYVDLPVEQFKQALLGAGLPEWSANALIDLQQLYRNGGASAVTNDVEQVLRRKPRSFEQFSRDYASVFQAAA